MTPARSQWAPVVVALLAVAALGGGACAPAAHAPASEGGPPVLEIVNRTAETLDISVAGPVRATVAAGARARIAPVVPGETTVRAQAPGGRLVAEAQLLLVAGRTARFAVLPQDGQAPLPEPPALGTLVIENRLAEELRPRIDGRPLRPVLPGDRRAFPDLAAGPHAVEAEAFGTPRRLATTLDVPPDGAVTWVVDEPRGTLVVTNGTAETVLLRIDGRERGGIAPGERFEAPLLLAGTHELEATARDSRTVYRATVDVPQGGVIDWPVTADSGAVQVENRSAEAFTVAVDGRPAGTLAAGGQLRVGDLTVGEHVVAVLDSSGRARYERRIHLGSGETSVWPLDPRYGWLRIVNNTGEPLLVRVDGAPADEVPAAQVLDLNRIPVGPRRVETLTTATHSFAAHDVVVSAETGTTIAAEPHPGRLTVCNPRQEAVRVFREAVFLADIAAGACLTHDSTPGGAQLLEAVGEKTSAALRERLVVAAGQAARWDVPDPHAELTLVNRSGEPLHLDPRMGAASRVVAVDETVAVRMPAGQFTLALLGDQSETVFRREWLLVDGAKETWTVGAPRASVAVFNRLASAVDIANGEQSLGSVAAGERRLFEGLPVGLVRLSAAPQGSAERFPFTVALSDGVVAPWEIVAPLAEIQVANRTAEALDIRLDGSPEDVVLPEASLRIRRLAPGLKVLEARGQKTGIRYAAALAARVDRTQTWTVLPAEALIEIVNERPESMVIEVDGAAIGSVPAAPASPLRFAVPHGLRTVTARGAQTYGHFRSSVKVEPERTARLVIRPETGSVDVVNAGLVALTLRVDGRHLGAVEPGAHRLVDGLAADVEALLEAFSPDGQAAYVRRLRPRGGQALSWTLP